MELSIVLVILGLLTGGILTGQSLIQAAEIRKITTTFQEHETAVRTFQSKYFALPGDMRNASDFWNSGCPNDGTLTPDAVCDGNGNGQIFGRESESFYEHLSKAGLVAGDYDHIDGPGLNDPDFRETSYVKGPGTSFYHAVFLNDYFDKSFNSLTYMGLERDAEGRDGVLTSEDAWSIDKKFDDGVASEGKIIGTREDCSGGSCGGSNTRCVSQHSSSSSGDYLLENADSGNLCNMHYRF